MSTDAIVLLRGERREIRKIFRAFEKAANRHHRAGHLAPAAQGGTRSFRRTPGGANHEYVPASRQSCQVRNRVAVSI
jgi:hypothetical protein